MNAPRHHSIVLIVAVSYGAGVGLAHAQGGLDDRYGDLDEILPCNVNVACTEGAPWFNEIGSVLRMTDADTEIGCTGTLLNNSAENLSKLYVLTANHCINVAAGQNTGLYWFQFYWQTPGCTNPVDPPTFQYVQTTAFVEARGLGGGGGDGDFSLLRLNSGLPPGLNVHFAGWSRTGDLTEQGVVITHPVGDVKKIAIDEDGLAEVGTTHWSAVAHIGALGEQGTSGAAFFDELHQVVGHVSTGGASCDPGTAFSNGAKLTWYWNRTAPSIGGVLDPPSGTGAPTLLSIANYDLEVDGETFSDPAIDLAAGFFRTAESITATGVTLEDTGRLHLRARDSITITGDFLAEAGGDFLAQIDLWSPPGGSGNLRAGEGLEEQPGPGAVVLSNYPNPVGQWTTFHFAFPESAHVSLKVYDVLGRELVTLFDRHHEAGDVTLHWNPADQSGQPLPNGVYVYRLSIDDRTDTRTMTVLK